MNNNTIFKEYDIRGKIPKQLNQKVVFLIGKAIVKYLKKQNQKTKLKFLINYDLRESSQKIKDSLIAGIENEGGKVIDAGTSSTPMHYFIASYHKNLVGKKINFFLMVTASHNPWNENGIKLLNENLKPVCKGEGLEKIEKEYQKLKNSKIKIPKLKVKTSKSPFQINEFFLKKYLSFLKRKTKIDFDYLKQFKIVFEFLGSPSSIVLKEFFKETNLNLIFLDSFPSKKLPAPNFFESKTERYFLEKIKKLKKIDFGFVFDGDGDRIGFLDKNGKLLKEDIFASFILEKGLNPKKEEKVVVPINSDTFLIRETLKKLSLKKIISLPGHSFVKLKMKKEKAVFGFEKTGHFYFKENFYFDSGEFTCLKFLEILSQKKLKPEKIFFKYKSFPQKLILFKKTKNFERLKKIIFINFLNEGLTNKGLVKKISFLDGIKIEGKNFWFILRESKTQPYFKLFLESKSKKTLDFYLKKIRNLLRKI